MVAFLRVACTRAAGLPVAAVLLVLGVVNGVGQVSGRPIVYDVTVAGLGRYQDADLRPMTPATVTRHVDGDTFEVAIADPPSGMRTAEKVRLIGIDTPELGEPFAAEALEHVRRHAGVGPVYLAFDFQRRDQFGRLLAFVYLSDGSLLNADLIEHGLAQVYRRDDLMYFLAQFERLEQEARTQQRGMWQGSSRAGVIIVIIRNAGRHEHVLLRNDGAEPTDLSGWRIEDDDGDLLMFRQETILAPGDTLAVGSGAGCTTTAHPCVTLSTKNIWGNRGDAAELLDHTGTVVDAYAY